MIIMNVEEAINEYKKKFGGFPYFLFMGASEETIIVAIEEALELGKEIKEVDEIAGSQQNIDY